MCPPEGPNRAELDRILPDRPAFFFSIDGHSLWANSKALEMAGVNQIRRILFPASAITRGIRMAR